VQPLGEVTFYAQYGDYIGRLGGYLFLLALLYYVSYRVRRKNHLVD
jgi:apolipoprotein N-acyltransferase